MKKLELYFCMDYIVILMMIEYKGCIGFIGVCVCVLFDEMGGLNSKVF